MKRGENISKARNAARKKKTGVGVSLNDASGREHCSGGNFLAGIRSGYRKVRSIFISDEQFVDKEVRFFLSPSEFHIVSFVLSLMLMAFILDSSSLIFFSVLSILILGVGHYMKFHYRPHDVLSILAIFFLPALLTIALFRDGFSVMMLSIYTISIVSTVIIYHRHNRRYPLLTVMWRTTYSKVVALSLAMFVFVLLPSLVLSDSFMSIFEMIFAFLLPSVLVFFFFSKFLYIYFFDRTHLRADIIKSLHYSIMYKVAFLIILICLYCLLAANFYSGKTAAHERSLDDSILEVASLESVLAKNDPGFASLKVHSDLENFVGLLRYDLGVEKNSVSSRILSLGDLMDDGYLRELVDDEVNGLDLSIRYSEALDTKEEMLDDFRMLSSVLDSGRVFSDGSKNISEYSSGLKDFVNDFFSPVRMDAEISDVIVHFDDADTQVSYFDNQGIFYWLGEESGLDLLYSPKSIFGRQVSRILRHSVALREFARLSFRTFVMVNDRHGHRSVVEHMYFSSGSESALSAAIRYDFIKEDILKKDSESPFWAGFKVF